MRILLIFFITFTLFIAPAHAATISDEGVTKLEKLFIKFFEAQKNKHNKSKRTFSTKGDIKIEKANGYYAVTLPPIEIVNKDLKKLKLGMIAINVTPTKKPDDWIMSAALPTPIFISDKNDKVIEQVVIGKQRFNARWNNFIQNFSKVDIRYEDIHYKKEKTDEVTYIQNLNIISNLEEENRKVTGPYDLHMKNIFFGTSSRPTKNTIEEVRLNMQFDDMPINSLLNDKALFNVDNYGDFTFRGNVKNIRNRYDLGSFTFEYQIDKPEDKTINQNVKFGYRGAELKKNKDDYIDLLPMNASINLDLNKLPYEDLIYIIQTKLNAPNETTLNLLVLTESLALLPSKMARKGTIFNIDDFTFISDIYDFDMSGVLKASDFSPIAVMGDIKVTASGLNEVESILLKKLKEEKNENRKKSVKKALKQINLIQTFCLDEDGENEYECKLVLDEEGNVKINNKSVGSAFEIITLQ